MRAVRFLTQDGEARIGALIDETTVRDVAPSGPQGFVPTPEGWSTIGSASGPEYHLENLQLLAPVVPQKILGIGLNYRSHAEESELDIPPVPVVFAIFTSALTGSGSKIVVPREETRPDYEGELAVVIGKRTYRATKESALDAIGGISAFHDVSGRRAQLETPLRQFTLGKSFDTFAPMGPCITSTDGVDYANIGVRTTLSGEVVQEANTRDLLFSVAELVEYCSRGVTLEPGDIIATGTPSGVGDSRNPRRYLKEGDVVEVQVDGVGVLRNPVVFER
jgi:2-keto-4-pentenoate hydratase/2-oxohepta-3-ene-1,7-dioic acid hydratase in catechol pathway